MQDHIRTYRVRSLHEALDLIRRDLGPDAAVLHTREIAGGLFGWRKDLEVVASAEVNVPARMNVVREVEVEPQPEAAVGVELELSPLPPPMPRINFDYVDDSGVDLGEHEEPEPSRAHLLQQLGISDTIAAELLADFADDDSAADDIVPQLATAIRRRLIIGGLTRVPRGKRWVAALVGATGVGKTTSLAKLAAGFRLQHRRVGLVTVDTYRVGAVDQLRTYAEIMDLPMEVASSPRDMREAMARLSHCEVVLIDTAGRSPRDPHQMRELGALLGAACPDEVHLVAGATSEFDSLRSALERFTQAGANRLLLTKTDEVARPGKLLSFLLECPLPLGYVTIGQNVPEDIRPADAEKLAEWLVGERDGKAL